METYKNLKKGTLVGLIISAVLCLITLFAQIARLVDVVVHLEPNAILITRICADLLFVFGILYYAFCGYKKPHGNMLKVVFILFGAYLALLSVLELNAPFKIAISYVSCGGYLIAALIVTYVAGRLNKIEKNRILLCLAGICLIASLISCFVININSPSLPDGSAFIRIISFICSLAPLFIHAALFFAYLARYEEHKAAGLADKADKEN